MPHTRYQAHHGRSVPLRDLPASALRAVLRDGYRASDLRHDVLAGLVVGIVALPLAMALAIAVGAPPQYGLYTAIVGGFTVAALGGSRTQVSGPTAAFIVILAPIYARFGLAGLFVSGVLAGLILCVMGIARVGQLIQFVPHPVTTGFTAGIATVIAVLQLKDLLGLTLDHTPEHFADRVLSMIDARGTVSLAELCVGTGTLAMLVWLPRATRRVPAPILALPAVALVTWLIHQLFPEFQVATIGSRFQTLIDGRLTHGIPQLPPLPLLPWDAPGPNGQPFKLDLGTIRMLVPSALAIAMLGAIESLLSAVVADGMARTKHDPDSELIALGIGNIVAPFFGGIPATGAIARTATNIRSGARSPIAAMVHALTVLVAVVALAPLLGYLPMASLAALLLLVAWNMSEFKHFVHTVKVAPKSDVTVLLVCYGLTVALDMVVGVSVGMVLAAFLFMRRMAEVTQVSLTGENDPRLPTAVPEGVLVYEISGPLFFGAAQKAMGTLDAIADRSKVVVLLMHGVQAVDATGLVALESTLDQLAKKGCLILLSSVQRQPLAVFSKAHVETRPGVVLCKDATEAFAVARRHIDAMLANRAAE